MTGAGGSQPQAGHSAGLALQGPLSPSLAAACSPHRVCWPWGGPQQLHVRVPGTNFNRHRPGLRAQRLRRLADLRPEDQLDRTRRHTSLTSFEALVGVGPAGLRTEPFPPLPCILLCSPPPPLKSVPGPGRAVSWLGVVLRLPVRFAVRRAGGGRRCHALTSLLLALLPSPLSKNQ